MVHISELSPLERQVLPLTDKSLKEIKKQTGLDETSILRALRFLHHKQLITLTINTTKSIELGVNGTYYEKKGLPERRLLSFIEKNNHISLNEAQSQAGLSDNEFKAALGVLKRKSLVDIKNNKLVLEASKEQLVHKFPEEKLLEKLPLKEDELSAEEKAIISHLKTRKDIIEFAETNTAIYKPTSAGLTMMNEKYTSDLLEEVTPDLIKTGVKGKSFRPYDLSAPAPHINGGKRHFVNTLKDQIKSIWLDLGFVEMQGPMLDSSFWVFDSLFTPQDHPARELQDTFYIKNLKQTIPDTEKVKQAHEEGIAGSRGWRTSWSKEQSEKVVMRTHTTSLSARTLSQLSEKDLPAKFFAIGKAFRNETIDWSHGIEFYQMEGIVIDNNATFSHLLGYLNEFYAKLGFKKIRFRPSFFPYTEPSVEIDAYHEEKKVWLEMGGAGILRPEVTAMLMKKPARVLAWGQGLDRMIMQLYKITDLRELYGNKLPQLRSMPFAFL